MIKRVFILLPFLLAGCDAIGDAADNAGEHLPAIGERCEHWQCVTEEGQKRSDEIKKENAAKKAAVKPEPQVVYAPQTVGKRAAPNPTAQ